MKKIKISAPGKLMLFGEHAVVYNRPCIVTAVDQRMNVWIETGLGKTLEIEAPEVGITGYTKNLNDLDKKTAMPKGVLFLEMAVKNFYNKYRLDSGLKITTKSEFSSTFGFGSSSAVTASTIKGLSELFKIELSKKELFDLAYKTVLDVQGAGSGFDLAATIWGGITYFVTGGKKIIPMKIKNLPLVIGYTGIKADTPTLIRQVNLLYEKHPKLINGVFDSISFLTEEAKKALVKKDFRNAGQLMNFNQGFLEVLSVSTPKLSRLIYAAREAGAYGAKLSGAGGGDCMIALTGQKNKIAIEKSIRKNGGKVISVKIGKGIQVE